LKITTKELRDYITETVRDELMQNNVFSSHIFEHSYVTGVLGISVPLNESYPYSNRFCDLIIQEQLMLEGFFGDFKKLGGKVKEFALGIRFIVEDPKRIKDFVTQVLAVADEQFQKFQNWSEKTLELTKKLVSEYKVKAMQIVGELTQKLKDALEKLWNVVNKMDGWKRALFAIAAAVGVRYVWDQIKGSGANELTQEERLARIDAAMGAMRGDDVSESILYATPSLVAAMYDTNTNERLDEFLKGLKDKAKKAGSAIKDKASKVASGAKDKAKDLGKKVAKKADEKIGASDTKEKFPPKTQKLIDEWVTTFKKLGAKIGKNFMAGIAIQAIVGALSGGIGTLLAFMAKAFGGIKYVLKVAGEPMSRFVGQIKNAKEEAKEAEKGEDDPTESLGRDAPLLRTYVRQKLIRLEQLD